MKADARSRAESSFEKSCAIACGPPQWRAAIQGEKEKLPRPSRVVNQEHGAGWSGGDMAMMRLMLFG
jgi:hypothetical protein